MLKKERKQTLNLRLRIEGIEFGGKTKERTTRKRNEI